MWMDARLRARFSSCNINESIYPLQPSKLSANDGGNFTE